MSSSAPPRSALARLLLLLRSNGLSFAGTLLAMFALVAFASIYVLESTGSFSAPYLGVVLMVALPVLFGAGLLMIPAGLVLFRSRLQERIETLSDRPMSLARAVVGLTVLNFAAIGIVGHKGATHMGSVEFCGTACHSAMQPEYDTYFDSPHSRVDCVECHVGPGATWFLKSKINGAKQLVHFLLDSYERPVPTPVEQLRPAEEICGRCHDSDSGHSTKLLVRPHFHDDEKVTPYTNVLLMRTGSVDADGSIRGAHWHTHSGTEVEYVYTDARRVDIPWVKATLADGTVHIFTSPGVDAEVPPEGRLRAMDCTDCHNRVAHVFHRAPDAVDRAIAAGRLSRKLPFLRKIALEALQKDWTREEAPQGIQRTLYEFYGSRDLVNDENNALIAAASEELQRIWLRNVYPDRGVHWDTYPSFATHDGCMRCHDGEHKTQQGRTISMDCNACHIVLSNQEESPTILGTLGVAGGR